MARNEEEIEARSKDHCQCRKGPNSPEGFSQSFLRQDLPDVSNKKLASNGHTHIKKSFQIQIQDLGHSWLQIWVSVQTEVFR